MSAAPIPIEDRPPALPQVPFRNSFAPPPSIVPSSHEIRVQERSDRRNLRMGHLSQLDREPIVRYVDGSQESRRTDEFSERVSIYSRVEVRER